MYTVLYAIAVSTQASGTTVVANDSDDSPLSSSSSDDTATAATASDTPLNHKELARQDSEKDADTQEQPAAPPGGDGPAPAQQPQVNGCQVGADSAGRLKLLETNSFALYSVPSSSPPSSSSSTSTSAWDDSEQQVADSTRPNSVTSSSEVVALRLSLCNTAN